MDEMQLEIVHLAPNVLRPLSYSTCFYIIIIIFEGVSLFFDRRLITFLNHKIRLDRVKTFKGGGYIGNVILTN